MHNKGIRREGRYAQKGWKQRVGGGDSDLLVCYRKSKDAQGGEYALKARKQQVSLYIYCNAQERKEMHKVGIPRKGGYARGGILKKEGYAQKTREWGGQGDFDSLVCYKLGYTVMHRKGEGMHKEEYLGKGEYAQKAREQWLSLCITVYAWCVTHQGVKIPPTVHPQAFCAYPPKHKTFYPYFIYELINPDLLTSVCLLPPFTSVCFFFYQCLPFLPPVSASLPPVSASVLPVSASLPLVSASSPISVCLPSHQCLSAPNSVCLPSTSVCPLFSPPSYQCLPPFYLCLPFRNYFFLMPINSFQLKTIFKKSKTTNFFVLQ